MGSRQTSNHLIQSRLRDQTAAKRRLEQREKHLMNVIKHHQKELDSARQQIGTEIEFIRSTTSQFPDELKQHHEEAEEQQRRIINHLGQKIMEIRAQVEILAQQRNRAFAAAENAIAANFNEPPIMDTPPATPPNHQQQWPMLAYPIGFWPFAHPGFFPIPMAIYGYPMPEIRPAQIRVHGLLPIMPPPAAECEKCKEHQNEISTLKTASEADSAKLREKDSEIQDLQIKLDVSRRQLTAQTRITNDSRVAQEQATKSTILQIRMQCEVMDTKKALEILKLTEDLKKAEKEREENRQQLETLKMEMQIQKQAHAFVSRRVVELEELLEQQQQVSAADQKPEKTCARKRLHGASSSGASTEKKMKN